MLCLTKIFSMFVLQLLLVHSLPLLNAYDCEICHPGPNDAPGVSADALVYICKYP
jgi:hypothetical protein